MAAKTSVHKKAPAPRDILEWFHLQPFIASEIRSHSQGAECATCLTAQRPIRILALLFSTKSLDAGDSTTLA